MFLRPQHFQQQERYFEFVRARAQRRDGVARVGLRVAGARRGRAEARQARDQARRAVSSRRHAVQHSGSRASRPATLDIPGDARGQRVLLALPVRRVGVEEVAFGEVGEGLPRVRSASARSSTPTRWARRPRWCSWATCGCVSSPSPTSPTAWMALGVARVVDRRPDNQLLLDDEYMPPHLALRALPAARGASCASSRGSSSTAARRSRRACRGPARGVSELGDFLLLELVNRWEPRVAALLQQGLHPFRAPVSDAARARAATWRRSRAIGGGRSSTRCTTTTIRRRASRR